MAIRGVGAPTWTAGACPNVAGGRSRSDTAAGAGAVGVRPTAGGTAPTAPGWFDVVMCAVLGFARGAVGRRASSKPGQMSASYQPPPMGSAALHGTDGMGRRLAAAARPAVTPAAVRVR